MCRKKPKNVFAFSFFLPSIVFRRKHKKPKIEKRRGVDFHKRLGPLKKKKKKTTKTSGKRRDRIDVTLVNTDDAAYVFEYENNFQNKQIRPSRPCLYTHEDGAHVVVTTVNKSTPPRLVSVFFIFIFFNDNNDGNNNNNNTDDRPHTRFGGVVTARARVYRQEIVL